MREIKLTKVKNGVLYVLKACKGCGDEWYARPKANRCSLCGSGLMRVRHDAAFAKELDTLVGKAQTGWLVKLLRETLTLPATTGGAYG